MLTAFVLVCALATARLDCNYATAQQVYQVPPAAEHEPPMSLPLVCMLRAQEWAGLHVQLASNEWLKVFCVPPNKLPGNVG
jgi:hypothetical protein